jgi:hypothetical protein
MRLRPGADRRDTRMSWGMPEALMGRSVAEGGR